MRGIAALVAAVFVGLVGCSPSNGPLRLECEPVPPPTFVPARVDDPTWIVDPRWVEERPEGAAFHVSIWFPDEVGIQPVYPIMEGSSAPLRVRYRVGREDTTTAITLLVVVDGRRVEVEHGTELVSRVEVPLPLGHAITDPVTIPANALQPGLNRVDLIHFIHRNGGFRAIVGPTLTIANGSLDERPVRDTPGLEAGTYAPGWQTLAYRTIAVAPELGETPFILWTPAVGNLDNPTHVSVRLQANTLRSGCEPHADNPDELMLIAFRDMEPVPIGERERVTATIPRGEQRIVRFDFHPDFPEDEFHHYVVIQLAGLSRPTRAGELAGRTPWTQATIVSEVFWGWHPPEE